MERAWPTSTGRGCRIHSLKAQSTPPGYDSRFDGKLVFSGRLYSGRITNDFDMTAQEAKGRLAPPPYASLGCLARCKKPATRGTLS